MVLLEYKQNLNYKSKPLPIFMNKMVMNQEYNEDDDYKFDLNIEVIKRESLELFSSNNRKYINKLIKRNLIIILIIILITLLLFIHC